MDGPSVLVFPKSIDETSLDRLAFAMGLWLLVWIKIILLPVLPVKVNSTITAWNKQRLDRFVEQRDGLVLLKDEFCGSANPTCMWCHSSGLLIRY
jgi:hypothetical protein